jgi:predicted phage-related endonuclease
VQKNILDHGHHVEALARPHFESILDADLYPVTMSQDRLSASCDGLTMLGDVAWEHKQWNEEYAAMVRAGQVPDEYMPQCQQVLMVTGAERLVFGISDGTPDRLVWTEVLPDEEWFKRIRAGWEQFEKDLADYQHVEILPAAVAAPVQDLPALSIRVDGQLTLNHNLVLFGEKLQSFIADIDTNPSDDQAFADAEQAIKVMERAENALGAAEASALGQISTVDEMVRTVASYKELARKTRLMLEKVVKARKETIRVEILQAVKDKAAAHIAALNARLGKPYMPTIAADFAGVMKNKRTIASLRDAVDTELARFKIEANAVADRIQINLATLRELGAAHAFLFADTPSIVLKAADDLSALVKMRIAEHEQAEAAKIEALRTQIAEEERVKAEKVAADAERARKDQEAAQARAEADARAREEAITRAQSRPAEAAQVAQVGSNMQIIEATPVPAQVTPIAAARPAAALTAAPALRLGQICERLGFTMTADFLARLGFAPAATDKSAKLFHEADFPAMCAALIRHISAIQAKQAA